ncbi:MAG: transposase family protein [Bryobacterales bacterium]|nr:transposase family protein [Bryobacterales bacterium]MDE0261103.1 transposase family protein [Bryobacterales bacterium]
MACDVVSVRLHLPQIRVLGVLVDTPARLVVGVESTLGRLRCSGCGFKRRRVCDHRDNKVTGLEVSARPVTLVWKRRRMVCGDCDSRFLEDRHAFEGALTARPARAVVSDARVMAPRAAARRRRVGRRKINALVRAFAGVVAERRRLAALPGAAGR